MNNPYKIINDKITKLIKIPKNTKWHAFENPLIEGDPTYIMILIDNNIQSWALRLRYYTTHIEIIISWYADNDQWPTNTYADTELYTYSNPQFFTNIVTKIQEQIDIWERDWRE